MLQFVVACLLAAPLAANQTHLVVGQSASLNVYACQKVNASAIWLEAGAHYTFTVRPNDTWKDAKICCTANGWVAQEQFGPILRRLARKQEPNRRCPCANWFELVGACQGNVCSQYFKIGCRGAAWTFSPTSSGRFFAFANDLDSRYHNNSGVICVTVTRVAAARKPLPDCLRNTRF